MSNPLRHPLLRIAAMSLPVTVLYALSWFGIFTFLNGYLVDELKYSDQDWTAVMLWYTGSMVVWPFVCSELSAWIGRRRTVLFALLLGGGLFLGFSFFHQRILICLMLACMALAVVIVSTVFLPMVAEAGGGRPGRALATFNLVSNGVSASLLIGGGYLAAHMGYTQAFLYCALACGVSAVLFFLFTQDFGDAKPAKVVSLRKLSRADMLALITGPFLIITICGMSMEAFNYLTVNQLWPNLARKAFDFSEPAIANMVALGRLPALLTLSLAAYLIDRVNSVRFYGFSFLYVAISVIVLGLVPNSLGLKVAYVAYFMGMGFVWGSNSPAVNASVSPRLRDSAFALMMVPAQLALLLVGIIHNRMLHAGLTLPEVFRWCGVIAALGGGLVLIVYSFSRRGRRKMEPAEKALVGEPTA